MKRLYRQTLAHADKFRNRITEHMLADGDPEPRVAHTIEGVMAQQDAELSVPMRQSGNRHGAKGKRGEGDAGDKQDEESKRCRATVTLPNGFDVGTISCQSWTLPRHVHAHEHVLWRKTSN